jgi:hypothetical protein
LEHETGAGQFRFILGSGIIVAMEVLDWMVSLFPNTTESTVVLGFLMAEIGFTEG